MKLKTPYYYIDKEEVDDLYSKLVEALNRHWDNFIIGYSYKTNSLPWIVNYFQSKGCYAEVVSHDEYGLSKLLNTPIGKCIYNGTVKSKESFIEAVNTGCIVNLDSNREISWLDECNIKKNTKIGIRVNFDIEKDCPGQSACGEEGGRFGFCYENGEFDIALGSIKSKGIKISGIHLHTSSKTRGLDIYDAISRKACEIAKKFNLKLDYIDIGGGFFGGLVTKPQFKDYFSMMESNLSEFFDKRYTSLIVEPGMSLIGSPVRYVTSVVDVKQTSYNRFVIIDGSRTNIDPLMTKKNYFFNIMHTDPERIKVPKQVICGFTCMEHDRLMTIKDDIELKAGDRIIYDKVGAYTMCLTPLFISYFPDVYIKSNGEYEKIRSHWTPIQYVKNSYIDGVSL